MVGWKPTLHHFGLRAGEDQETGGEVGGGDGGLKPALRDLGCGRGLIRERAARLVGGMAGEMVG